MSLMDSDEPPAMSQAAPPSYRFFLGDAEGQLKSWSTPCPPLASDYQAPLPQVVTMKPARSSASGEAVQKMASGVIEDVGFVIVLARRNATIDVVLPPSDHEEQATLLATIQNDQMKAGLQRWVGLAVGSNCIYAATSAGDFTKTVLKHDASSASSSTAPANQLLTIEATHRLSLPEPLQSVVFYPASHPSNFLYGGEEIPLSIWNIDTALSTPPSTQNEANDSETYTAPNGEAAAAATGENSKMRKRKRQAEARAKAKELLWGEVWRAKNLPNDSLSLPQRPNITSIAVLAGAGSAAASPSESADDGDEGAGSGVPKFKVAVGTRDGLVRIFDPSSGSRKHVKEISVVKSAPIKSLVTPAAGFNEGEVIAADGEGKLSAVDWLAGKLRYQWKDITGAISSVVALPPPTTEQASSSSSPLAVSSSLDRLLRLHTFPSSAPDGKKPSTSTSARGQNLLRTFTGGAAVTAIVWDGMVPSVAAAEEEGDEGEANEDESMNRGASRITGEGEDEDDDNDEEAVWDAMQEVGDNNGSTGRRRSKRLSTAGGAAAGPASREADDEDAEAAKEERSKRTKKEAATATA